jgi:hypothetical protein
MVVSIRRVGALLRAPCSSALRGPVPPLQFPQPGEQFAIDHTLEPRSGSALIPSSAMVSAWNASIPRPYSTWRIPAPTMRNGHSQSSKPFVFRGLPSATTTERRGASCGCSRRSAMTGPNETLLARHQSLDPWFSLSSAPPIVRHHDGGSHDVRVAGCIGAGDFNGVLSAVPIVAAA